MTWPDFLKDRILLSVVTCVMYMWQDPSCSSLELSSLKASERNLVLNLASLYSLSWTSESETSLTLSKVSHLRNFLRFIGQTHESHVCLLHIVMKFSSFCIRYFFKLPHCFQWLKGAVSRDELAVMTCVASLRPKGGRGHFLNFLGAPMILYRK